MADMQEYKCPACGGALSFDVGLQTLKCPYCESVFDINQLGSEDGSADEEQFAPKHVKASDWTEEEQNGLCTYICNSCAGEIITDANTGATSCPYCDNPIVMSETFRGKLRPDLILPFKLNKEQAIAALKGHYKKRPLLPNEFKDANKLNEIKGIYVPFWLYSGKTDASFVFKATKLRKWSDSKFDYVETSYFDVHRSGSMEFSGVPVDASTKMPDDLMDSLEPYDLKDAVDFKTAYMAGYLADKFDVDEEACQGRADSRVKNTTENTMRGTIHGYNSVSVGRRSMHFANATAKYVLLPVWLLNTKWKDKQYTFAMNGQTGKFVGELPIDGKKSWSYIAAITGGLFAAVSAIYLILTGGII